MSMARGGGSNVYGPGLGAASWWSRSHRGGFFGFVPIAGQRQLHGLPASVSGVNAAQDYLLNLEEVMCQT